MKNSNQNKDNISSFHKDKLGMDIPEGYFAKSKENILSKLIIKPEAPKQTVFWLKPMVYYPIAASIVLAMALTLWMKNDITKNDNQITTTEEKQILNSEFLDGDFLITSLMVSDSQMNTYLDSYIINNVVMEAEKDEQQLENIFLNSVLIEDSLINSFLDKSLIENFIL
ncbi:hypothetical protein EV196_10331 [Mariniflexile fucanivorans]|uniref:Uncharacterized protein n=1 Tax=Mariniflexile fucanivorans TaxID=264023 RepID=A0A4R1RLH9_9FLAO|nr:hypothetical protein [Mariniflexile fucanivorans]TCL66622.1 hypothetical protein EV196_10331 [Mariniflexile fucanivorans]